MQTTQLDHRLRILVREREQRDGRIVTRDERLRVIEREAKSAFEYGALVRELDEEQPQ